MNLADPVSKRQSAAEQRRCLHCRSLLAGRESNYCCRGCEYIHNSIQTLGLEGFYRIRGEAVSPSGESISPQRSYAYLENQGNASHVIVEQAGDLCTARFYLPTIHCPACAWILEQLPMVVEGVRRSRVALTSGEIELIFDPTRITLVQLAETLHSIGYPPVPPTDEAIKKSEDKERRHLLVRIGIAALVVANTMMLADPFILHTDGGMTTEYVRLFTWLSALLAFPVVTYCAFPFYRSAIGSLLVGRVHIDIPISVAIISAYCVDLVHLAEGKTSLYLDSITCLIFLLLLARYAHKQALRFARRSAGTVWDFLPAHVRVWQHDSLREIPLQELARGDVIEIRHEDRLPADGVVTQGASALDYSMLTGESLPSDAQTGEQVLAGGVNRGSTIRVSVSEVGEGTRFGRMLALFKQRQMKPPWIEQLAQRLSLWFTVLVLFGAGATYAAWTWIDSDRALDVTISLLIITCPCALGLAIPVTVAVALGSATRSGLFVQNAQAICDLSKVKAFYFDKTGTLTSGNLSVESYFGTPEMLEIIKALATKSSRHPVARAIEIYCADVTAAEVSAEQHIGRGVSGQNASGETFHLGSLRWFREQGLKFSAEIEEKIDFALKGGRAVSLFGVGNTCQALFVLADPVRPEARQAITALLSQGISCHILSGDQQVIVQTVAEQVGIDLSLAWGELLPEAKAEILTRSNQETAFIGDGMNDLHALRAATVGIALRGGIEAGIEIADVFVARGGIERIPDVLFGTRKMQRTMNRNILISCAYNICCALLAVTGNVTPLVAALAMPISSLVVVLSSTLPGYFHTGVAARRED